MFGILNLFLSRRDNSETLLSTLKFSYEERSFSKAKISEFKDKLRDSLKLV